MKALKSMLLCVFTLFVFAACNSSSSDSVPPPVVPSHFVANTGGGLYIKSADGVSWKLIDNTKGKEWNGLTQLGNKTLIASMKATVARAAGDETIWISEDLGVSWRKAGVTADGETISRFIDFADNSILACGSKGLWRSEDGAKSWKSTSPVVGGCISMTMLRDGSVIIHYKAADQALKIWRSADNGKTWSDVYSAAAQVSGSFYEFANGLILSAGLVENSANFILKSADYGKTWTKVTTPAKLTHYERFADGVIIAAGGGKLYKSADGGDKWDEVSFTGAASINSFIIAPDGSLFASAESGIVKSADKGATWKATSLKWTSNKDVASFQILNGEVYAIYSKGTAGAEILKLSGEKFNSELAISETIRGFLPLNGGAGTGFIPEQTPVEGQKPKPTEYKGFIISTALGNTLIKDMNEASWKNVNKGRLSNFIQLSDGTLLACEADAVNSPFVWCAQSTVRSEDFGVTWVNTKISDGKFCSSFAELQSGVVICAGTDKGIFTTPGKGYLFRSEDKGKTWEQLSGDYDNATISVLPLGDGSALVASPNIDGREGLLYKVTGDGKTVRKVYDSKVSISAIVGTWTVFDNVIFTYPAMSYDLLKSNDFGETWKEVVVKDSSGYRMGINPVMRLSDGKLLAECSARISNGMCVSADDGDTWNMVSETGSVYYDFIQHANGGILRIGPSDSFAQSADNGLTWEKVEPEFCTATETSCYVSAFLGNSINGVSYIQRQRLYPPVDPSEEPVKTELWKTTDNGTSWEKDSEFPSSLGSPQGTKEVFPILKYK